MNTESKEINHKDRGHSELGASSAHRWMKCTASYDFIKRLRAEGKIPEESPSSIYAEEGTAAHELSELCLLEGKSPHDHIGELINNVKVTEEMANAVKVYVDYIHKKAEGYREILVEEEFSLEHIDEEMFGTNDCCILDDLVGELEIIDYKHGMGVEVEVENNPQLLYYALGAYKKYNLEGILTKLTLTVVQPRVNNGYNPIKSWVIDEKRLLEFEAEISAIVKNIREGKTEWVPGEHCRWCPARANCPALRKQAVETVKNVFKKDVEAKDLTPAEALTDEQVIKILENGKIIKDWIDSVYAFAQNELIRGGFYHGFKLVESTTRRSWRSEEEVIARLSEEFGEDIYEKKLLGLTKMQKVVGKKLVDELAFKPEGQPVIAPESDKRKPLSNKSVKELFQVNSTPEF